MSVTRNLRRVLTRLVEFLDVRACGPTIAVIAESGLFDADWYLKQNPHVLRDGLNPLAHYVTRGAAKGCNPHPLFDEEWYETNNPDLALPRINPLAHYIKHGMSEGRDPHPLFDTDWYLAQNPDVAASRVNPLAHY